MVSARNAREWAKGALRGIGDSLYTPFGGPDGDDIDWDAYRALVRYCVGTLGHPMLWLTSGLAEFWSLTKDERKRLLEVAIEEARAINQDVVIQACTAATAAKDCLELTLHAQEAGADIVYIQTPAMEVHAGEGVMRFMRYIADRTDIALGLFNSPSSGYELTSQEVIAIYERIPAICAIKEGTMAPRRSREIATAARDMQVWECNELALTAGWAGQGIVVKAQLGSASYLVDFPGDLRGTKYYELLWSGRVDEANAWWRECGMDRLFAETGKLITQYPGRPGYFTHWGAAVRFAASLIGMPMGDYPHSRPPQGILSDEAKERVRRIYEHAGVIGAARTAKVPA